MGSDRYRRALPGERERVVIEEYERRSMPPLHEGALNPSAPPLVVCIGASAGSLEAIRELFEALDDDAAGMAFVLVQHLDPEAKSLLPSIVTQFTALPVHEIEDGATISGNIVHVAPPNAIVELHSVKFDLTQLVGSDDRRTPIDALFRSVAASFGPRAVGIVLSGVGSDGTVGIQQIANEGGMTFAQTPMSAKFDSMPRSAIASGVVDHVLTPREMAEVLLAYVGQAERLIADSTAPSEAVVQALPEICDLLQKATDHNFKHYKTSTLARRVHRRMQVLRLGSVEEYVDRLRNDADELVQLFREMLIGVTAFFRDPEAFETLQTEVLRPLVQRRRGEALRIWVPGCATGEEAYTLAMLVSEALDGVAEPPDVQIFATDIDERALSFARQGIFPAGVAENIGRQRLERFFIKKGKRFQITKEIREKCLFSPHNLINDPPFSRLDLISCRNLLIYFGPHLQKKLMPLFHYALRPNGYLFLGPSENISAHKDLFTVINAKHRISQRKATAINSAPLLGTSSGYRGGLRSIDIGAEASEPDLHQLMQRMLLDEFAPKAVIVTEEGQIVSASGEMERYLTVTEGTFQNNVVRLARPGLRVGLRAALSDAIKIRRKVVHDKLSVQNEGGLQRVRLTVQPMPRLGEEADLFLVVFQDLGTLAPREESDEGDRAAEADSLIEQLERELSSTREDLEKTIQDLEATNEELKSSNEELLSMNEELQSANEELETSKEEVQTTNEALARAHANLSNLLTSTAIATIFLDEDLNIQSFTPAASNIYNLLASDVSRPLAHITYRCTRMPPLPGPAALRAATQPREDDVLTEDGRWYLRRALPYHTHDGKAEGMVVTFIDVTALKHAEEVARWHEQQMRLITDSLPVLISYVDAEQKYRFNNLAYERWFGKSRDSLKDTQVRELLGEAAYRVALPYIHRALAGETVSYESQIPYGPAETRFVRADYVPDRAPDGTVRGYFSLKHDVTDTKRVAEALAQAKHIAEEASRAKSEFLAMMSHEIRTPMTAILGYAELLQTHTTDPDNLACIDAIKRNGQHLVTIINDILDLSKIEARMLRTESVRSSPGGLLRDVVDSLRTRAAEKGLTLELVHENPLPQTIATDPTRVRQILFNLIGNAIKFTERGGVRVVARFLEAEGLLELSIIDTGVGISPEQQSKLFEPFTQANSALNRQFEGTGLGLAITKSLVELLGGSIHVESAPKQGSKFTFTIPTGSLGDSPGVPCEAEPPLTPMPPAPRLTGIRVLVVDDRRDMRHLMQTYLEEGGASVDTAADGASAVERVKSCDVEGKPFDVVVLDIQMPGMDGYEAAPLMRAAGFRGGIVALTANAMRGDRDRCLSVGCDEYLMKPVSRLQLLHVVAKLAARSDSGSPPLESGLGVAKNAQSSKVRILLVDDNEDSSEALAMLLDMHGFEVLTAATGARAISVATGFCPDAVLLDIGLPDMDGFAVLEHLKQIESLRSTRFIALSGMDDDGRLREAGFHHRIVKPPQFQKLLDVLPRVTE